MKTAYNTIVAMRNTSSKLEKQAILEKQKNNAFLKEFLRLCYEPKVNFYVKKIDPKLAPSDVEYRLNDSVLTAIKGTICNRKLTGKKAREALSFLYNSMAEEWECEMLNWLIERDCKAGFSDGTINKVWPGMLTDVPYMRCCLPKETDLKSFPWKDGVFSQMKADGMFANVNNDSGVVTITSRNGSPFPMDMFPKLAAEVKANIREGYQLHGELLMYRDGKLLERKTSNGRFNSILQGGELEEGDVPVYVAWDMIPLAAAKAKGKLRVPYETRFGELTASIGGNRLSLTVLRLIDYRIVRSIESAYAHYKAMLDEGYEGTILKHPEMIWEDTTSKFQVKLKLTAECDLRIDSFTEGNGKNAKTFGSIQCSTSDGKLEVGVSGFGDKTRQEFSDDRANMIGKIMTVKANAIMAPKKEGGKYSLFLPRFEEIRLDKKVADSLDRVQAQFDAAIASVAG